MALTIGPATSCGKNDEVERHVDQPVGGKLAAVYVDEVADRLKREERDADRQQDRRWRDLTVPTIEVTELVKNRKYLKKPSTPRLMATPITDDFVGDGRGWSRWPVRPPS